MEESIIKSIELSFEEAKLIMTVFILSGEAHKRKAFLYEEELIDMEIIVQKLKRVFLPEEFNKTLH